MVFIRSLHSWLPLTEIKHEAVCTSGLWTLIHVKLSRLLFCGVNFLNLEQSRRDCENRQADSSQNHKNGNMRLEKWTDSTETWVGQFIEKR